MLYYLYIPSPKHGIIQIINKYRYREKNHISLGNHAYFATYFYSPVIYSSLIETNFFLL